MERICERFHNGVYDVREPIVRCRDCKNCGILVCSSGGSKMKRVPACFRLAKLDGDAFEDVFFEVEPDGFCAWGELRHESD